MTNQQHPITPPQELLKSWEDQHFDEGENYDVMMIQAYQAGAAQELEACCEILQSWGSCIVSDLRAARRKPLSLKEQALRAIDKYHPDDDAKLIRRALETRPND